MRTTSETVGRAYQGLVRYWLTFNEINSVALSYLNAGVTLEDERDRAAVTAAFSHHMFMASARAVRDSAQDRSRKQGGLHGRCRCDLSRTMCA